MSTIRVFAVVFGIVFLVVGICGFIPPLLSPPMPGHTNMVVHSFDGRLFGLFHVNAIHSAAHLLFGVLGLVMAGSTASARAYAWIVAIAYGGLVVLGLFPATNTLFGLMPIHGNDVWLHIGLAVVALVFALIPSPAGTTMVPGTATPAPAV